MAYPRFLFILLAGVVCSFCETDFVSLGRHAWRCKQRIHRPERHNVGEEQLPNDHDPVADTASRVCLTKCCCGKLCKENRGLKMHQRSCRVVLGLNVQLRADLNDITLTDQEYGNGSVPSITSGDYGFPDIKTGISLPKSDSPLSVLFLNPPITAQNLSSSIKLLNDTIYDYFSANFGQVAQATDERLIKKVRRQI